MNKIEKVAFKTVIDSDPDLSYLGKYTNDGNEKHAIKREYTRIGQYRCFVPANPKTGYEDLMRMDGYGDWWHCVGCYAEAVVVVNMTTQYIRTAGLWGVENDSSKEHFAEIKQEELAQLIDILLSLGFSETAVQEAIDKCQ